MKIKALLWAILFMSVTGGLAYAQNAPVIDPISPQFVDEGEHLEFVITASDTDGDSLEYTLLNLPTNASFVDSGNGHGLFTFDPDYSQSGNLQISVIAQDSSMADTELVDITVNDVNRAPEFDPVTAQSVDEGAHLEFALISSDLDGDGLTLTAEDLPANATFVDSGNGHGLFEFDPDYTQSGEEQVRFIASDGTLADTITVDITINDYNSAPTLTAISGQSVDEGSHLGFLVEATDPESDILTLTAENLPTNATFTDSGNGTGLFEFDPSYIQNGTYNVRFIADDGFYADTQMVSITVNRVNVSPVITAIPVQAVDEGQHLEFAISATDINDDVIDLLAENMIANSSFTDNGNGQGTFTFDPDYSQSGIYNVRFVAEDGELADTQVVEITVNHINLAPVIDTITAQSVDENTHFEYLLTSSDFDSDALTFTVGSSPLNSSFTDYSDGTGLFEFDPTYLQSGVYNVSFIVADGALSDTMTMSVTVNDVNAPPVLGPIGSQVVDEKQSLGLLITASDVDGQSINMTAEQLPENASFIDSGNGNGWFVFDPDSTQSGEYAVRFIASDGAAADTQLVDITVNQVNVAPSIDPISLLAVDEGDHLGYVITATDFDNDAITLSMYNDPLNSAFVDSGNGHGLFTFDPDFSQEGSYTVRFIVSDGVLADTSTMGISVNHFNTAPVIIPIGSQEVAENQTLDIHVLTTDNENDNRTITLRNAPANSSLADSGNGNALFTFTPGYDQTGNYNVTFIVNDGEYADSEIVAIEVTNTNRAPELNAVGSHFVDESSHLEFVVTATEPDLQSITLTAQNLPLNASFTDSGNGNGLFSFDPNYVQAGTYTVRFIASDGELADTSFGDIVVNNINRLPVLASIGSQALNEGEHLVISLTSSDEDTDDDPVLSAENVPSMNATFTDSGNGNGSFIFDPDYTQSGVYNVLFIINDGIAADSEMVTITVNEYNLAPELAAIGTPQNVSENQTLLFNISATDPDGVIPTLAAYDLPSNATFVDSGNGVGTFTFSPDYFQAGSYDIIFAASDGNLADSQVVEVIVDNLNRAPELTPITAQSVDEGGYLGFNISASDPDLETLTITAQNIMPNASFTDSGNGAGFFEFNPNYTQAGNYIVRFIVSDSEFADTIYVDVTVNAINAPPVLAAIPTPQVVGEEDNLEIIITAIDPDGTTPTLAAENLPTNAAFSDNGDGSGGFTFDPVYGQAGGYDILFIAGDGEYADSQIVHLDVVVTNSPPILDPISAQATAEGDILQIIITASDPDLTSPFISAFDLPENAAMYDSGNGHAMLEFIPDFDQEGVYNIMIIASDGSFSDTGYAEITVSNTNVSPVWQVIDDQDVDEGDSLYLHVISSDYDNQALTLTAQSLPLNSVFSDSGNGHGLFRFGPDFTQSGIYNLNFIVSDGEAADTEAVEITVNQINMKPAMTAIGSQSVDEAGHLEFTINTIDFDGDSLILSAEDVPINATFTDLYNNRGDFTFDPDYTQSGVFDVLFIVSDGDMADSELVAITVNDINLPPQIDDVITQSVDEGEHLEFVVTSSDFDPDLLTLIAENMPTNAAFYDSGNGHGLFIFDPDYSQANSYQVRFIVDDGDDADTTQVDITVNDINVAPELAGLSDQTVNEGETLELNVTSIDYDLDTIILTAFDLPANASFYDSTNGTGLLTFTPDYTQGGDYTIGFIAADGALADTEYVTINVEQINIAPELAAIGAQNVDEGGYLEVPVSGTDFDNDALTLIAQNLPTNASFFDSGNGSGSFVFNPSYTQAGNYQVRFIVDDGVLADTELVVITVVETNRAPSITPLSSRSLAEGGSTSFVVFATDPDGVIPALEAFDIPTNSTFEDFGTGSGLFGFNPDFTQAGIYNVGFIASDGELVDTEYVEITVNQVNIAPELNPITDQVIDEGDVFNLVVMSTDYDNDILTMVAEDLPSNATFTDSGNGHGLFRFSPDYTQTGDYTVRFIVSDSDLADTLDVGIIVNNTNRVPVLGTLTDRSVNEDDFISFIVGASDPDGVIPVLTTIDLPANASFEDYSTGTGLFTFSPDNSQSGLYTIGFVASDGDLADTGYIDITVNQVNLAPVLNPPSPQSVEEGGHLEFVVTSSDYDLDALTLSAEDIPLNATFTDSGNGHGLFTFDPSFDQAGVYHVRFIVSDSEFSDSALVSITVGGTNLPPVGEAITDREVNEGGFLSITVNFSDPDGQLLAISSFDRPSNSSFVDNGNNSGRFEFNPDSSQAGSYIVGFIGYDGSLSDTIYANIDVNDINVAPYLDPITTPQTVTEGQTLTFNVSASDYDGNTLTLTTSSLPAHAAFTDSGNGVGTFRFTPNFEQSGDYEIWFNVSDGSLNDSQLVEITVNEINRAPEIADIMSQVIDEGSDLFLYIKSSDPDGQIPVLSAFDMPIRTELIDSSNGRGTLIFRPNYSQSGIYNIGIVSSDGDLADTFVVDITVNDINLAPEIDPLNSQLTNEGEHLELVVTSSDFDEDNLVFTVNDLPLNAVFTDSSNGHGLLTFDPDYSQSGVYNVQFIVSDGDLSDTATVEITVLHINMPPELASIGSRSVAESGHLELLITATDLDAQTLILTAESLPLNAVFSDSGNGHGLFMFDPDNTQAGTYNIRFIASDGTLADSELVEITVNDVNQAPVLAALGDTTVNEGGTLVMTVTATDFDNDTITLNAFNLPTNASFTDNGGGSGTFDFSPDYSQDGAYTVGFVAGDGDLADTVQITVTVNNSNQSPTVASITDRNVNEGAYLSFIVSATDPDGVTPSLAMIDGPLNATFDDNGNGSGLFTFSPGYTQAGAYDIGFVGSDGELADTEYVQITVNQINIGPSFDPISAQVVSEGGHLEFAVISTDFDDDPLVVNEYSLPTHAAFEDSGNGHGLFTFDPDYGQSGVYTVRFISSDGSLSDTIDVAITVTNNNLPPTLGSLADRIIDEDDYLGFVVSAGDPDGTTPVLSALDVPVNGTFEDNGNGSGLFTFNPDYTQSGVYTVTFFATDGELSDTGTVEITVNNVNLAPELDPISPQSVEEGGNLELVVSSTDFDGDQLYLSAENIPANSSFADSGNGHGLFTFNPSFDQDGVYYIRFISFDGSLADSQLVSVSVGQTNLPPVGEEISAQVIDEQATLNFPVSFTDPDGQLLILSSINAPANSSFHDNNDGTGEFEFNPDSSQAGDYTVGFIGYDGLLADTVYAEITVNDVNVAPILGQITSPQTVAEGQLLTFAVAASDFDANILTLTALPLPTNAVFDDSGNGHGLFTFSPDYTQSGQYDIWFKAADSSLADSQLVVINVTEFNRSPVITSVPSQVINEGETLQVVIEAVDPDGQIPVLSALDMPTNAVFTDSGNGNGLFEFTPDFNQNGNYTVRFIATDSELSDTISVEITVNESNLPPELETITDQDMDEGTHLEFIVSSFDPDLDELTLTALNLPSNAAFTDSGNGHGLFTFDPDYTQAGDYQVSFISSDGDLADTMAANITVNHVNLPPELAEIGAQSVDENGHLEFVITSSDFDEQALTLNVVDLPINAAFTDSGNGHGLFAFDPDYTQAGVYPVLYIVSDGELADSEMVNITVNDINLAPEIAEITDQSVAEGEHLEFNVIATDFDENSLSLTTIDLPANATFDDSGNGHGLFAFDPDFNQQGVYDIGFVAGDGNLADTEYVQVTVYETNLPPVITPVADRTLDEGAFQSFVVSSSDPDGTTPTLTMFNNPANTLFEDNGNGTGLFQFSPDYTQSGVYDIGFIASDGVLADTEMVQVTVNHINIAPVLEPVASQVVSEGGHLEFVVASSDFDADVLTLLASNMPSNATFADSGNGHGLFEFDPVYDQGGNYNVRFICSDGDLTDTIDVTITVNNTNQSPELGTLTDRNIDEDQYLGFVVSATDPDGTTPILSVFDLPTNAQFEDNGNGTGLFTFRPDYSQAGVLNVGFIASDGELRDTGYVEITVNQVNLAPELGSILPQSVEEGGHLEMVVLSTDFDNDALTLSAEDLPVNAVFSDSGNGHGLFVFDPTFDQEGIYYIRFIVTDGALADSQLVSVSVGGTNLPPVGEAVADQEVAEQGNLQFAVTFADPDGQLLSLSSFDRPGNSSFIDNEDGTGSFTFDPDSSQAGVYDVGFVGFDGLLADTVMVSITVTDVNVRPSLDTIQTPQLVVEGESLIFGVTADDFDGNVLNLTTSTLPTNAAFVDSGNNAGSFSFSPDFTQSGSYDIWFIASDTALADSQMVTISVVEENLPPVLADVPAQSIDEGGLLEFVVISTDPDGQTLSLWALDMPDNATFDDSGNGHGLFSFSPDNAQAGEYAVGFVASDGGLNDTISVDITVNHINLAPVLDTIGPLTLYEGTRFELVITSSDFDLDELTLTASNLPVNASFADSGNGHGLFVFDPAYGQAGDYTVTFITNDGVLADTEIVEITVQQSNRPPKWETIPNYSVQEGGILQFTVAASDPDSTTPALSIDNYPANITFVDSGNGHGWFRFAPSYTQSGVYDILFLASDGDLVDTAIVQITVNESGNQHPVITPVQSQEVNEGEHLEFVLIATDPEGSIPILSAMNMPANSAFIDSGNGHGLYQFDPDFFQSGVYDVSFIAFDGQYADTELVEITVYDVGFAPELDPIGPQTVAEGSSLELTITGSDPDLTFPELIAENLPENATFTDSGNGVGVMIFNPDYTQAGVITVLFIATDGALSDSEYVQVTVTEFGNVAPILELIPDISLSEGDSVGITISAADPDGNVPFLSVTDTPSNTEFDDNLDGTGTFIFQPDYYQAGEYDITFIADDGELADSQMVHITVSDRNGPPAIDEIMAQSVTEGDSLGFLINSVDPDNNAVTLSADDVPENAYLVDNTDGTGVFNFLPGYTQAGLYEVFIIASDGESSDSQIVSITVNEAGNQAPQFNPVDTLLTVVEGDSLGVVISAYDEDGDMISFNYGSLPFNSGFTNLSADSILFYFKPNYTQVGSYTVNMNVSDGSLSTDLRISIDVLEAGSLAPIFDPIEAQSVDEGDTLLVNLSANDPDGTEPPIITINNPHPHSEFTDNGDGTAIYRYMPDYLDADLDTLVFIAIDSENLQGILRVEVTTDETNLPPDLMYEGDSVAIQGETMRAQLIATDTTDSDGGPLFLSALYLPDNAQFTDNGDHTGEFEFSPAYDQVGLDSAVFIAVDDDLPSMSSTITVHIEIRSQNRRPVWDPIDSYEIDQAETLTVDISATDPDGDTLILQLAQTPAPPRNASIVDNGDGTGELIFAPDYTQQGVFIINLVAYDLLDRATTYAFVMVNDLGNQPPTLNFIEDITLDEGDSIEVVVTATDPDSTSPAILVEGAPHRFNYLDNGDGTMDISFIPLFNQAGTYELLFMAMDSDGAADSQYVNITVIEVGNQPPRIDVISFLPVDEMQTVNRLISASDPDSTIPSLRLLNPPENATFVDSGNGYGRFIWTPNYFQSGTDTLVFRAIDEEDSTVFYDRQAILVINNVNRPPTMEEIVGHVVAEGETLGFLVTADDPDNTFPILRMVTQLNNTTFTDSGNGVGYFSFTPAYNQSGYRPVMFYARDVDDTTVFAEALARITVTNVNRPPVMESLPEDTTIADGTQFELTITASDPDGNTPSLLASNMPSTATFVDNGDGTGLFRFLTDFGDVGDYAVTFWARDPDNSSVLVSQTVTIHVIAAAEHAPYFVNSDTTISTRPLELLNIMMEAIDYDGDALTFSYIGSLPTGAVLTDGGDGTAVFNWTPSYAQNDSQYTLQFVVTDATDRSDTYTMQIEVRNWIRGDANGDGSVLGSDVVYLVNYFRSLVPRPEPVQRGDANGDGDILGSDVTYLVNYFRGVGPPPPPGPATDDNNNLFELRD